MLLIASNQYRLVRLYWFLHACVWLLSFVFRHSNCRGSVDQILLLLLEGWCWKEALHQHYWISARSEKQRKHALDYSKMETITSEAFIYFLCRTAKTLVWLWLNSISFSICELLTVTCWFIRLAHLALYYIIPIPLPTVWHVKLVKININVCYLHLQQVLYFTRRLFLIMWQSILTREKR